MPFLIVLAYGFVAILSVFISGWLSYKGLLEFAGEITLPLVVFIMSIILAMDMVISYFRHSERRYLLPVIIFFIAAFFSITSNFNHLYTNFMREDVTRATVTRQLEIFRDDLVETRSAILSTGFVARAAERRAALDQELNNLGNQVYDTLRPGCGEICQEHLVRIQNIVGAPITDLAEPNVGADEAVVSEWLNRYEEAVRSAFATSLSDTNVPALTRVVDRIRETLVEFDTAENVISSKGGLDALQDMSETSRDIMRQANALLPESEAVEHTRIDPDLGRLGEIAYSLQNGFIERPNPIATGLALLMASIVDLLPFMLSFALFGRGRLEKSTTPEARRGGRGRGPTVVTGPRR